MKSSTDQIFLEFILTHWNKKSPLLLALSGGPDSLALYALLLDHHIPFSVAHINHQWREESGDEASALKAMCYKDAIPYYEKTLFKPLENKNLEAEARASRLAFYKEILSAYPFQAVVLGHHADDQAETVLKRIFEGASLPHLKGLMPVTEIEGITLFRPLLAASKKEILTYLARKQRHPFWDKTNEDPAFLRGRMRTTLLPFLSENFGKEVSPSLNRLGKAAGELHEFLENWLIPYRNLMKKNELDLSGHSFASPFEWKLIVRDFFERHALSLTTPTLEMIVSHLQKGSAHKEMIIKDKQIRIHRKTIRIQEKEKIIEVE